MYILRKTIYKKDLENEKNRLRHDEKQAMMGMQAQRVTGTWMQNVY